MEKLKKRTRLSVTHHAVTLMIISTTYIVTLQLSGIHGPAGGKGVFLLVRNSFMSILMTPGKVSALLHKVPENGVDLDIV